MMQRILYVLIIAMFISCNCTQKGSKQHSTVSEIPTCVQKLIEQFRQEEKTNPPRQIYEYAYKGAVVYYVPAPCCDFYSDLYNSDCSMLGHPDGGFTGKGDGKYSDFEKLRTGEKLIWKDERP
jgi:hypothetical protein